MDRRPDGVEEADVAGEKVVFAWCDGVQYELSPLEPEDLIACRTKLHERMHAPEKAVAEQLANLDKLPEEARGVIRKELMDRLYQDIQKKAEDRVPSPQEVGAWIGNTDAGTAYTLYLMIRRKHPDFPEAKAEDLVKKLGKAAFVKWRNKVNARLAEK